MRKGLIESTRGHLMTRAQLLDELMALIQAMPRSARFGLGSMAALLQARQPLSWIACSRGTEAVCLGEQ